MERNDPFPIFSAEIGDGIYLISEERRDAEGQSLGRDITHFGGATGNSYLILGKEKAQLIDSTCCSPGIRKEADRLAKGRTLLLTLTHAHVDHTFHLEEFESLWLHPADEGLLRGAYGWQPCEHIPEKRGYLGGGDVIDLGDRKTEVYWLPGHTDGSILFYDQQTRFLFSGDAVARRNLYGTCGRVPLRNWLYSLYRLNFLDIRGIYSAHDRPCLPKTYINYEICMILKELKNAKRTVELKAGNFDRYVWMLLSDEEDPWMVDFAAPLKWREELLEEAAQCQRDPLFRQLLEQVKKGR